MAFLLSVFIVSILAFILGRFLCRRAGIYEDAGIIIMIFASIFAVISGCLIWGHIIYKILIALGVV
jgi:hypothetical protein